VSGLAGAVAVTAGLRHSCALLGDGTVRCWGSNGFGELGAGTVTDQLTAVSVSGLTGVVAVTAGNSASCALLGDGTVQCWGYNSLGGLGDGTTITRGTAAAVTGLTGAVAVTAGSLYSCALLGDGTIRCWGFNREGSLGDGTFRDSATPVAVSGLAGVGPESGPIPVVPEAPYAALLMIGALTAGAVLLSRANESCGVIGGGSRTAHRPASFSFC
jgi:alpha-tubulin suppressor-like RCC1 family protein